MAKTNVAEFIQQVRQEMSRVTWPTRREVWTTTIVVILTSLVFGLYLWVIDLGLSWIVEKI